MTRITKKQLKDKEYRDLHSARSKMRTINNKTTVKGSNSHTIEKSSQILDYAGFITLENQQSTENNTAINLLNALGIVAHAGNKEYSLLTDSVSNSFLDDENTNLHMLNEDKNKQSDPQGKFPNPNDPFYQLDSQPEISLQKNRTQIEISEQPNVIAFSANLVARGSFKSIEMANYIKLLNNSIDYSNKTHMPSSVRNTRLNRTSSRAYNEQGNFDETKTVRKNSRNTSIARSQRERDQNPRRSRTNRSY